MARPVVSAAAEDLYEALGPFTAADEGLDWPLLRFCEALTTNVIAQIHGYVVDPGGEDDDTPGFVNLLDPDECPAEALSWLAQFVGVEVTQGMTEAEIRAAIKEPEGWNRGSLPALLLATKRTLTGSQTVLVDERYTDDAYKLRVRTLASETPSEAVTEVAVISQKPIGILLTFDAITTWDWGDLQAAHATWADVQAAYPDWLTTRTQLP